ncbi:MAG: hypothetical protein WAM58_00720 [Candidatus Acidiferrum sp.]
MIRNDKAKTASKPDSQVKTHRTQDKRPKGQSPVTPVPPTSKVPGLPPTDNLHKHPDEAYGDTEIPQRGAHLDKLKTGTN